jgi:hypothetical protein
MRILGRNKGVVRNPPKGVNIIKENMKSSLTFGVDNLFVDDKHKIWHQISANWRIKTIFAKVILVGINYRTVFLRGKRMNL